MSRCRFCWLGLAAPGVADGDPLEPTLSVAGETKSDLFAVTLVNLVVLVVCGAVVVGEGVTGPPLLLLLPERPCGRFSPSALDDGGRLIPIWVDEAVGIGCLTGLPLDLDGCCLLPWLGVSGEIDVDLLRLGSTLADEANADFRLVPFAGEGP